MPDVKKYAFDNLEFIAMLCHDMKTPIKAQLRAMELLYSGVLGKFTEEANDLILNIIASNKYMQCLVDNVLGNFRLNKGKFVLNKTKNDLRETIERSINNVFILSDVKNQKIKVNAPDKGYILLYDEIEIQRVVVNLLSNAFEYAKENSLIEITLNRISNGVTVYIRSFSSNPAAQRHEFELNQLKAGTGLGLIICEAIINAHNGRIENKNNSDGTYEAGFFLPSS